MDSGSPSKKEKPAPDIIDKHAATTGSIPQHITPRRGSTPNTTRTGSRLGSFFTRRHSAPNTPSKIEALMRATAQMEPRGIEDEDDDSSIQSTSTLPADNEYRHPCEEEVDTVKAGWLLKQTTRKKLSGNLAYNKRYFILGRSKEGGDGGGVSHDAQLSWYESLKHTKPHDSLVVGADCVVRSLTSTDKPRSRKYNLELTVPGKRVYVLRANDPGVRDAWVAALDNVVKEAKERVRVAHTTDEGTSCSPPVSPSSPLRPRHHNEPLPSPVPYVTSSDPSSSSINGVHAPRAQPSFFPSAHPQAHEQQDKEEQGLGRAGKEEDNQEPQEQQQLPLTPPQHKGGRLEEASHPQKSGDNDSSLGDGASPALGRFYSPKQHQSPLRYTRPFFGRDEGDHGGGGALASTTSPGRQAINSPGRNLLTSASSSSSPPTTSPQPRRSSTTPITLTHPNLANPFTEPSPLGTYSSSPDRQAQRTQSKVTSTRSPSRQPILLSSEAISTQAIAPLPSMGTGEDHSSSQPSYLQTQHAILLGINTQLNAALEERRKKHEEEARMLTARVATLQEENTRLRNSSPTRRASSLSAEVTLNEGENEVRELLRFEQQEVARLREEGRTLRRAQEVSDRELEKMTERLEAAQRLRQEKAMESDDFVQAAAQLQEAQREALTQAEKALEEREAEILAGQAQVELLQKMNSELEDQMAILNKEVKADRDRIRVSEEASQALRRRVADLESQLGQANRDLTMTTKEVESMGVDVETKLSEILVLRSQLEVVMTQHEEVARQADQLLIELKRMEDEEESLKTQTMVAVEEKTEMARQVKRLQMELEASVRAQDNLSAVVEKMHAHADERLEEQNRRLEVAEEALEESKRKLAAAEVREKDLRSELQAAVESAMMEKDKMTKVSQAVVKELKDQLSVLQNAKVDGERSMRESEGRLQTLEGKLAEAQGALLTATDERTTMEKSLHAELEELREQYDAAVRERDEVRDQSVGHQSEVGNLRHRVEVLETALRKANEKEAIMQDGKKRLREEVQRGEETRRALDEALTAKEQLDEQLKAEKVRVEEFQEQIAVLEAMREELITEKQGLEKQLAEEKSKVDESQKALKDAINAKQVEQVRVQADSVRLEEMNDRLADLESTRDRLEREKEALKGYLEERLQREVARGNEARKSLEEALRAKEMGEKLLYAEKTRVAEIQRQMTAVDSVRKELDREKESLRRDLENRLKEELAKVEKAQTTLDETIQAKQNVERQLLDEKEQSKMLQDKLVAMEGVRDEVMKEKQAIQRDLEGRQLEATKGYEARRALEEAFRAKEMSESLLMAEKARLEEVQQQIVVVEMANKALERDKEALMQESQRGLEAEALKGKEARTALEEALKAKEAMKKLLDSEKARVDHLQKQVAELQAGRQGLEKRAEEEAARIEEMRRVIEEGIKKVKDEEGAMKAKLEQEVKAARAVAQERSRQLEGLMKDMDQIHRTTTEAEEQVVTTERAMAELHIEIDEMYAQAGLSGANTPLERIQAVRCSLDRSRQMVPPSASSETTSQMGVETTTSSSKEVGIQKNNMDDTKGNMELNVHQSLEAQVVTLREKLSEMEDSQHDLNRSKDQMKKTIQELKSDQTALAMENEVFLQQMAEVNRDITAWLHIEDDLLISNKENESENDVSVFELIKSNLQEWRDREAGLREEAAELIIEREQLANALAESKKEYEEAKATLTQQSQSLEIPLPQETLHVMETRWQGEPAIVKLLHSVADMEAKHGMKEFQMLVGIEGALQEHRAKAEAAQAQVQELEEQVEAHRVGLGRMAEALAKADEEQSRLYSQRNDLKDDATSTDDHVAVIEEGTQTTDAGGTPSPRRTLKHGGTQQGDGLALAKAAHADMERQLGEVVKELQLAREELVIEKGKGQELKKALNRSEEVLQGVVKESEDLRSQLKATRTKGEEMAAAVMAPTNEHVGHPEDYADKFEGHSSKSGGGAAPSPSLGSLTAGKMSRLGTGEEPECGDREAAALVGEEELREALESAQLALSVAEEEKQALQIAVERLQGETADMEAMRSRIAVVEEEASRRSPESEVAALKKSCESLRNRMKALQEEKEAITKDGQAAQTKATYEIGALVERLNDLTKSKENLERDVECLRGESRRKQAEWVKEREELVARLARVQEDMGRSKDDIVRQMGMAVSREEKLRKENQGLELEKAALESQIHAVLGDLQKEKDACRKEAEHVGRLEARVKELEEEVEEVECLLTNTQRRCQEAEGALAKSRGEVQKLEWQLAKEEERRAADAERQSREDSMCDTLKAQHGEETGMLGEQVRALEEEKEAVIAFLEEARSEVASLQEEVDEVRRRSVERESQVEALTRELEDASGERDDLDYELQTQGEKMVEALEQLEAERDLNKKLSEEQNDAVTRVKDLEADLELAMEESRQARQELDAVKSQLEEKAAEDKRLRACLVETQRRLEVQTDKVQSLESALDEFEDEAEKSRAEWGHAQNYVSRVEGMVRQQKGRLSVLMQEKEDLVKLLEEGALSKQEASKLTSQRRQLEEEWNKMECMAAELLAQKRSIDNQLVALSKEVTLSIEHLRRRKQVLQGQHNRHQQDSTTATTAASSAVQAQPTVTQDPSDKATTTTTKKSDLQSQMKRQKVEADLLVNKVQALRGEVLEAHRLVSLSLQNKRSLAFSPNPNSNSVPRAGNHVNKHHCNATAKPVWGNNKRPPSPTTNGTGRIVTTADMIMMKKSLDRLGKPSNYMNGNQR